MITVAESQSMRRSPFISCSPWSLEVIFHILSIWLHTWCLCSLPFQNWIFGWRQGHVCSWYQSDNVVSSEFSRCCWCTAARCIGEDCRMYEPSLRIFRFFLPWSILEIFLAIDRLSDSCRAENGECDFEFGESGTTAPFQVALSAWCTSFRMQYVVWMLWRSTTSEQRIVWRILDNFFTR